MGERMTREEAIQLARSTIEKEGWPWWEPVYVTQARRFIFFGKRVWRIFTNSHARGCNAHVELDDETGQVLRKGFIPR